MELNYYRPLKRRQHGGDQCDNCGKCNKVCPMQLDVMSELKRAHPIFKMSLVFGK